MGEVIDLFDKKKKEKSKEEREVEKAADDFERIMLINKEKKEKEEKERIKANKKVLRSYRIKSED